jgi:hypothetical protein
LKTMVFRNASMKKDPNGKKSTSGTSFYQKESNKFGFLRRFLEWLARGAKESGMGGRQCPT